jgi:hypothetical protein
MTRRTENQLRILQAFGRNLATTRNTNQSIGKDTSMNHISRTQRPGPLRPMALRVQVGVAVLAAVMAAGCSSSSNSTTAQESSSNSATPTATPAPTPAAPAAAQGVEAPISDVPWSKVGPGWMLAVWSPVTPLSPGEKPAPGEPTLQTATTTLYLIDPAGNRYALTTFRPQIGYRLVDWSGDGSHALLSAESYKPSTAISVDLHTGAQTTIPVDGYPRYARPDGKAILVSTHFLGNEPGTLKRIDLNGNPQLTYPTEDLGGAGQFSGRYLESPDGTQLVLGTANLGNELVPRSDNSLVVMDNDGTIVRTLSAPMSEAECSPARWWTPTVILAHCSTLRGSANQLWKVPLDGGAPTALTAVNSGQQDDPGFEDDINNGIAWQLPSGTFLQSAGACGDAFLSLLTADGRTTRVNVPGVSPTVRLVGATGDKLVLQGQVSCGGTMSLMTYDPAANTSTVLLGPPIKGGGVPEALLFPGEVF